MEIKMPPTEDVKVVIREEYIDIDGHIKDGEKELALSIPK